ncbi:MAG TPA: tetratricopeptide repeat-containing protein [Pyrinomonadaceae bacterium]|nr:tetratricopeptide repeat-containing protein [Pyrinomonadaceae bacterium]
MRAFIIRPFGTQKEIDFNRVDELLISPALTRLGADGRTTLDIFEAGNIRVDMFRRLLTADIVVADLSIHNANVFYELGIRHALRDRGTVMLRCEAENFPFDLQTDRYFVYKKEDPAAALEELVQTLKRTVDSTHKDSPVFMSLPELVEPDPSTFMAVPLDFSEEIERALADNRSGDLALISNEVRGFEWEIKGWRTVGRAQFNVKAYVAAKETWEAIRKLEPSDLEANLLLGTIYERLGDLTRSTQALDRALKNSTIKGDQRAEAYALLARNAKTRWRADWEKESVDARTEKALLSPYLKDSYENYERAFSEDLNHFYSGLNALAMLSIMIELAAKLPDNWNGLFDSDDEAARALATKKEHAKALAAAVDVSLAATLGRLKHNGKRDVWAEISVADLRYITSTKPARVAAAYREALAGAPEFACDSLRKQLSIYRDLGVVTTCLAEVEKIAGAPTAASQPVSPERKRVLLFAGHMIDAPGREKPRFPADKESIARAKIKEAIVKEMQTGAGVACGYAGAASGGDLLFQEVCAELGIPTRLYLAIPPQKYVTTSVAKAGPDWVTRFWNSYNAQTALGQVRVLSDATDVTDEDEYLPVWLRSKPEYTIWQRNNLWMLFNALNEGSDPKSSDPNVTLIALWDGATGDGAGGTADLVDKVEKRGARSEVIKTKEIFGL